MTWDEFVLNFGGLCFGIVSAYHFLKAYL